MKQYEVLLVKELFRGSDVIRGFSYKMASSGTTMPIYRETDCFKCCSPWKVLPDM